MAIRKIEAKTVGTLDLDTVKTEANRNINSLLDSSWLDPDTKRDFMKKQKNLQRRPFALQNLAGEIQHEIITRKQVYGR